MTEQEEKDRWKRKFTTWADYLALDCVKISIKLNDIWFHDTATTVEQNWWL